MKFFLYGLFVTVLISGCSKQPEEHPKADVDIQKEQFRNHLENEKKLAATKVNIPQNMDVIDAVKCTAAAMKSGQGIGLYKVWTEELTKRYSVIYPDKSSEYIDQYISDRIDDKLKYLKSTGLDSTNAFKKYYQQNCE